MLLVFQLLCTCSVSVETVLIGWLIQETELGNVFMCRCHGLELLSGSVFVVFPSVVLMLHSKLSFINPLPVQFKSLLPGQEGCVFFQWAFKYMYLPVRFSAFRPAGGI
jgi:hypothetical protein